MKCKKSFVKILALLMIFSFAGCAHSNDKKTGNDTTCHYVEGTLHNVNVQPSSRKFIENGRTDYVVLYDKDVNGTKEAASWIQKQIKNATECTITVSPSDEVDVSSKAIVIGDRVRFEKADLTMPKGIDLCGYYIKSHNDSVFIEANGKDGFKLGAIAFLREVLGYDMLAEDCIVFEKSGATLPTMDIVERPDMEFRTNNNGMTEDKLYGQGWNNISMISVPQFLDGEDITVRSSSIAGWHNYFYYVPYELHNSYPEWFYIGKDIDNSQLCLNAHGNNEMREKLIERVASIIITLADENPQANCISFTQTDNTFWCNCEACNEVKEQYGSNSASVILFLNEVDTMVQGYLEEKAEEEGKAVRDFDIVFFAYLATQEAPKDLGKNNELKCHRHVVPMIAPLNAFYTSSFYEDINSADAKTFIDWEPFSEQVNVWIYETNFHNFLYPYDSFYSTIETYRFLMRFNVKYILTQGQGAHENTNTTGFGKLKEYLDSKAGFNVNVDYNALCKKFFKYYFLDAEEPMREFFDITEMWLKHLKEEYSTNLPGGIYEEIGAYDYYWPQGVVNSLTSRIADAKNAIAKYEVKGEMSVTLSNGAKVVANGSALTTIFDSMKKHIELEEIFPRFVNCQLRADDFAVDEIVKMRKEFVQDCLNLGIKKWREGSSYQITALGW